MHPPNQMTVASLIAFNVALVAAIAIPGPAFLAAVHATLNRGRSAGIAIGCGLGLTAAAWTMTALLGLDVVFSLFPWAYSAARVLGAVYLLYLACRMWRGAGAPIASRDTRSRRSFVRGVLVNLLNPKSVLFAAAVLGGLSSTFPLASDFSPMPTRRGMPTNSESLNFTPGRRWSALQRISSSTAER